jgi:glycosyltransferase involved in cell wall biosynthesis
MGKKRPKFYPTVSVCTPTFNRRPFFPTVFECFKNQTYPKEKMEWIIVDDGTDKIKDLIENSGIPQIKYFELDSKLTLGAKRNLMHEKTTGSIIVYMDDDDYYPPERVEHAVDMLLSNKEILVAGSSELYIYFNHINKMYQAGPYKPHHATAGTFAFKKELLEITRYNDSKSLAEEQDFLKDYSIPMIQLDSLKTILVFSHSHNTFDKKKLLDNPISVFKQSDKTVEHFIKFTKEARIKKFFMQEMEGLLDQYEPGRPIHKPDVLLQTKETDDTRLREKLKFHHVNFNQCINEIENLDKIYSGKEPTSEIDCIRKLNLDLIVSNKNLNNLLQEKDLELRKLINLLQDKDLEFKKFKEVLGL